jgi:hypothetical protein
MELPSEEDKHRGKIIVSRVYNADTSHIFAMCALQPALTSYLHQDAIIREEDASLVKLRMLKNLSDTNKEIYKTISRDFDSDYEEATKSLVVTKLVKGEIEKTTINDIVFTAKTATYENISVEAEDLLSVLQAGLNFSGEFDIYRVIDVLVAKYVLRLNVSFTENEPLQLKINNMPLYLKTNNKSGHNFINNIRINQDEVRRVLARAGCYQSIEQYTLFLKSVRKMSLKMHDVLANGVAVKFHPDQAYSEYNTSEPRENAPALNFVFDSTDKKVKLKISDSRKVYINIARFLRLVETLNAKTDNRVIRGSWTKPTYRRDYNWCAAQLVKIIKKCCTVMTEVKREDGTSYTIEDVLIQKEDILSILEQSKSDKLRAIEKSKEFLDIAVKSVGAEKIVFKGEAAYKVKGALRTYAVVVSSAKVFDFDTQKYRCIVNSSHYKGTGFDDVAARLLALKNDSVMQNNINTLAGEAHNHEPEVGPANPAHRNPIALYEGIVGTAIENEFGE